MNFVPVDLIEVEGRERTIVPDTTTVALKKPHRSWTSYEQTNEEGPDSHHSHRKGVPLPDQERSKRDQRTSCPGQRTRLGRFLYPSEGIAELNPDDLQSQSQKITSARSSDEQAYPLPPWRFF